MSRPPAVPGSAGPGSAERDTPARTPARALAAGWAIAAAGTALLAVAVVAGAYTGNDPCDGSGWPFGAKRAAVVVGLAGVALLAPLYGSWALASRYPDDRVLDSIRWLGVVGALVVPGWLFAVIVLAGANCAL